MVSGSIAALGALLVAIDKLTAHRYIRNIMDYFSTQSATVSKLRDLENIHNRLVNNMAQFCGLDKNLSTKDKLIEINEIFKRNETYHDYKEGTFMGE